MEDFSTYIMYSVIYELPYTEYINSQNHRGHIDLKNSYVRETLPSQTAGLTSTEYSTGGNGIGAHAVTHENDHILCSVCDKSVRQSILQFVGS